MTLQWTIIAFILYVEIALCLILLLPWIRPSFWSKIFHSRLYNAITRHANIYGTTFGFVLFILFADGIRENMKYNNADEKFQRTAESDATHHMRLFRAQRNLYISGFSLLLFLIIRRIMSLLMRGAQLEAASEAAMRQAENASKVAKTLMNSSDGDSALDDMKKELEETKEKLQKANTDRDTLKKQAEGLQNEFNRVSDLLEKAGGDASNKKDD